MTATVPEWVYAQVKTDDSPGPRSQLSMTEGAGGG